MDHKELYDKCDKELKRVIAWIKEYEEAFDMMDLKLHYAAAFDDWDDFPIIKKAIDQNFYQYGTPFYEFVDQAYENLEEWCNEQGIDFDKLRHQVGRTSKFYLHDQNLIDVTANGINYENTIDWLVNHFGWPGSFEDNKDGMVDREWMDQNWDDDECVENNVKYIASGEFYDDVTKEFEDTLEVYDYIKGFKDDQTNIYKDWLAGEEEWLKDSHPEFMEESKKMVVKENVSADLDKILAVIKKSSAVDVSTLSKWEKLFGDQYSISFTDTNNDVNVAVDFDPKTKKFDISYFDDEGEAVPAMPNAAVDKLQRDLEKLFESKAILSEKAIRWFKAHGLNERKINKVDQACNRILEGKNILTVIREGVSDEDKKHALLKFLNLDSSPENFDKVKQSSYNDNMYEFEGQDFLVCTDDEADEECKESILNLIDELGLESFSPYAQDYIIDNFVEDDSFQEYFEQDMEDYASDIQNEGEKGEVEIDGETVEFDNRLVKELLDCGALDPDNLSKDDFDEDGDYVGDEDLVELYCKHYDTPEVQGYASAAEWYKFNFGDDQFVAFAKENAAIDWDQVAEWSMEEDGRGHELNRWDGHEYEEDFDGETYYIYPQDDYKELMGDEK